MNPRKDKGEKIQIRTKINKVEKQTTGAANKGKRSEEKGRWYK